MKFKNLILFFLIATNSLIFMNSCGYKCADLRPLNKDWQDKGKNPEQLKRLNRSRDFAKYSAIYSIAAVKSYTYPEKNTQPIEFPSQETWNENINNGEILDGAQESIGFSARSWIRTRVDKKQELVIAYRGTSHLKDFAFANLIPFLPPGGFPRNQYKAAYQYAVQARNLLGNSKHDIPIVLTGHSLGGGLAEYVQRYLPNSHAITFATSPNQGRLYGLFKPRTNPKDCVRLYEKGEILSYFRYVMSPDLSREGKPEGGGVRAAWVNLYWSNPITSHFLHDHCVGLLKVSASANDPLTKDALRQLQQYRTTKQIPNNRCVFD